MERLALVTIQSRRRRPRPWHGWQPGPPEPHPLFPAERRFEWLAFVATPISGIMAVVSPGAAGGLMVWLILLACIVGFFWAIRELSFRLPSPALRVFERFLLASIALAVTSIFLVIGSALWKSYS